MYMSEGEDNDITTDWAQGTRVITTTREPWEHNCRHRWNSVSTGRYIGGLSTALQNAVEKPLMPVGLPHLRFLGVTVHSVGTSYAQAALSAQLRSPLVIMRCWHDTPEHDYGIVLLGTSLVRITIPRLIYVTHLDP
ncbi:unnamed protein product [Ranitomeya imitator]|uniref:Uncharacterized protein n=1 Tax=Ranitomeya imitator TaxID=111125 RepID=A0ABN9MDY4_9NEOB|nr:unnamed protein product [Ranitomeya imitator]